jgi:hypothetical protein
MQHENLYHFCNLCDKFRFNTIWRRWSMATLVFCRRLTESYITVTPSVTCMDWLHWWYYYAAHIAYPSTALTFLTNISKKYKSTSPSAIQVKNGWKTISIEEKLDIISWLEKGERTVEICCHVRLAHSRVFTIHVMLLIELRKVLSQELGLKCSCCKTTTVLPEWTAPKTMHVSLLHFYCIRNK